MLNEDSMEKLANLANISLSKEELSSLVPQLEDILNFVEEISDVKINSSINNGNTQINIFRKDEIDSLEEKYNLIECAPSHHNNYVEVPKVIDK